MASKKRAACRMYGRRRSARIAEQGRRSTPSSAQPDCVDLESSPEPSAQSPPHSPPHSPSIRDFSSSDGEGESSTARSEDEEHLIHFRNLEEQKAFDQTFNKEIKKGRSFTWSYLEEIQFPYLQKLKDWRWKNFITNNRPVYKNLCKYFYFNGTLEQVDADNKPIPGTREADGFHTYLHGRHLRVTHAEVREALGNPRHRPDAPKYNPKMYDPLQGAKLIWDNKELKAVPMGMEGIPVHNRILHLMVCRAINPRSGSHAKMTTEDIWYMEQIMNGKPPNLAALVMKRLKDTIRLLSSTRGVYYGRVVSQIIDGFKIEGLSDGEMDNRKPVPFSSKTIRMTGFSRDKETGEWSKIYRKRNAQNAGETSGKSSGKTSEKTAEDVAMEMAIMAVPDDDDATDDGNDGKEEGAVGDDPFGDQVDEGQYDFLAAGEPEQEDEEEEGVKEGAEGVKEGTEGRQENGAQGAEEGAKPAYQDADMNDVPADVGVGDVGAGHENVNVYAELQGVKQDMAALRGEFRTELQILKREQQQMAASILQALRGINAGAATPVQNPTPTPPTREGQH